MLPGSSPIIVMLDAACNCSVKSCAQDVFNLPGSSSKSWRDRIVLRICTILTTTTTVVFTQAELKAEQELPPASFFLHSLTKVGLDRHCRQDEYLEELGDYCQIIAQIVVYRSL